MPFPTTTLRAALVLVAALALAACSGDAASTDPNSGPPVSPGTTGTVSPDGRPFALTVPDHYDPSTPMPLVVGLHGYTSDGGDLVRYLGLDALAQSEGFLLAIPEGTTDAQGEQFWNATSACCDFDGSGVDDSAYLATLITTVMDQYAVDPARVTVVGHSNGGFMALRMACDHADLVTAVASIAGSQTQDPSACDPARPVSVLQVHGDSDQTIRYLGGDNGRGREYPGAAQTVEAWRGLDGCTVEPRDGDPLDLEATLPGAETAVAAASGCEGDTEVALWTIEGGRHVPTWTGSAGGSIIGWLLDHPRGG